MCQLRHVGNGWSESFNYHQRQTVGAQCLSHGLNWDALLRNQGKMQTERVKAFAIDTPQISVPLFPDVVKQKAFVFCPLNEKKKTK